MSKSPMMRWFSRFYKSFGMITLMALLLSLTGFVIGKTGLWTDFENKTIDFRFRAYPIPERADSNIVLIAIDDASLKYANSLGQGWPLPRAFYAVVNEYLDAAGAKSIIYDMMFDERDFDRADIDSAESDAHFTASMYSSQKVILSQILSADSTGIDSSLFTHAIKTELPKGIEASQWQGSNFPIADFCATATSVAGINLLAEKDAVIRKIPLLYKVQEHYFMSLGFAAYRFATSTLKDDIDATELKALSLSPQAELFLNWYGKGGADGTFSYLPFSVILHRAVMARQGLINASEDTQFAGKHFIIGATSAGLMDLKSSPYTWGMPGMEVWATLLSNLLNNDFVRFAKPWQSLLWLFILVWLILYVVLRLRSSLSTALVMLIIAFQLGISFVVFGMERILLELVSPTLTLVFSWVFVLTLSYIMEGKHKKELRMVFNRYLHPDLVNRIAENPDLVQMGGEELHCSVMFSDIYNFTGFSEKQSPTQLVSYLNEYFSTFTNSILDHKGLLDKYTGDGLMAVFGAPLPRTDHPLLACQAALAHRDFSLKFKDKAELSPSEAFHLNTRLGINSGILVAGNIGSERRMEYTSIGDTVNLAARLEGVNKVFGTHIIISESTYLLVKDQMLCRELDFLRVKGKKEPTRIYELLCAIDSPQASSYTWIDSYHTALKLYRKGDWAEAQSIFVTLTDDSASYTMQKRCAYLIQNPPPTWDGILTLEEK